YLVISAIAGSENVKDVVPAVHISTYSVQRASGLRMLAALVAGITIGALEIFYLQHRFRKKAFGYSILVRSIIYSTTMTGMIVAGLFIDQSAHLSKSIFHPQVIKSAGQYLSGSVTWAFVLYWIVVFILTQVFLHVRDTFGHGVLLNLIMGKYHKPKEEERIFMFLDIKSSTAIAEKLGHIKHHDLLRDFFDDATDPIIFSKGKIYQYVGDEIVVSWSLKDGIENSNCVACFFGIRDNINRKAAWYIEKYGLVPGFKAGMHCGDVTAGEVGVVKREIVFSGDTLNTAARIQGVCNTYDAPLLVSRKLLDMLPPDGSYHREEMGEIQLRGKQTKEVLFKLERVKSNRDTV
ncbi:MAG: adenylate/guanylate cyclase domain-containing protein, partial [bacterium]|nr:adenylate/guanylate cyclase domain-containing protein [bacterium]